MITKADMERMCRNANMMPAHRETIRGREIFVADGFSKVPHFTYAKFGAEKGDFPDGAFCTLWFSASGEENLDFGLPLFFEAAHNPELGSEFARLNARVHAALLSAHLSLHARDYARLKGLS